MNIYICKGIRRAQKPGFKPSLWWPLGSVQLANSEMNLFLVVTLVENVVMCNLWIRERKKPSQSLTILKVPSTTLFSISNTWATCLQERAFSHPTPCPVSSTSVADLWNGLSHFLVLCHGKFTLGIFPIAEVSSRKSPKSLLSAEERCFGVSCPLELGAGWLLLAALKLLESLYSTSCKMEFYFDFPNLASFQFGVGLNRTPLSSQCKHPSPEACGQMTPKGVGFWLSWPLHTPVHLTFVMLNYILHHF